MLLWYSFKKAKLIFNVHTIIIVWHMIIRICWVQQNLYTIIINYGCLFWQELYLTRHQMLHDGSLVWKINNQRQIDVHVVLLEDLIVILQREGGKYLLRAESSSLTTGRSDHRDDKDLKYNANADINYQKYLRSPIINLRGLMTRTNAAGKFVFTTVYFKLTLRSLL